MIRFTLALLILSLAIAGPAPAAESPSLLGGNRALAPGFKVKAIGGGTVELDTLRAHGPVLLDFWATWCKPCLASLPEIEALHRRHRARGLTVVGVSIDGPRNFVKVRPFASRLGLSYPIVLDEDGRLQQNYRVLAVPTTFLVARDGTIRKVQQGYRPGDTAALEAAIDELLAADASQPASTDSLGAVPDSTAGR
ncbi:MAG TPA: TlpA disulfide reductase family protein [Candidatus Limnocylindria bacterium]|nr:TlpA disulfide reductase family protein [Candidatus Limnocylindria bacterium]